ncbi:TonB-dependent receptor [Rhodopseudomonas palustris]|uniref:TonB-dependent receptor n=1 Tax=Rhodopseudomonas palustris TaxID=1076 RepID=A0AAX3E0J0_RHOPL|nr:TonB-dependent receptor [Rhodopseudomonas palustris]UYO39647.1 TonB-dependent receptor [Rhodopseudomonas palustris]
MRRGCAVGCIVLSFAVENGTARAEQALPQVTIDAPADTKPKPPRRHTSATAAREGRAVPAPSPSASSSSTAPSSTAATDAMSAPQNQAASSRVITGAEINALPFMRPGEALEAAPGLVVTQHSGEGKANQYFLRGFNLDHGTDLAITIDGMPVNMPTHGHGQGYADVNFLIPELISTMTVRKGPYFADVGDFGSAGALGIEYLRAMPKTLAEVTVGSFGYRRLLGAGSTRVGDGTWLAAFEANTYNGPWDVPDNVRKLNGVLRYSQGTATDGFSLTGMAYSNRWTSTDQVAQRAIDQGLIGRYGSLDPTDGGIASRYSLSGRFAKSSDIGQTDINAYVIRSSLQLYNNFTYFLDDPVNGDQFNQHDRRTVLGLNGTQRFDYRFAGLPVETRVGLQTRSDTINVGLNKTYQRDWLSTVRADDVSEQSLGLWTDTTVRWTDWLRTTAGVRQDFFTGRVISDNPANSGNASAAMTSPKAGIVLGPWVGTEFYGNAGTGLHSNDIRGATITVDPNSGDPVNRVPLLVRSKGAELGIRNRSIPGLTTSLAVFVLDFDSELLFVGDAGTTEPSRPSRRVGVEWTSQYRPLSWLGVDLDVAYTKARFTDFDPAGDFIPGAPAWVASAGITLGEQRGWFGALKGRYFGPRPLIEDDSVHSLSSLVFNARAGYRFDNGIRLQLDVLNLFNAKTNQIEYYYLSRLPGEPLDGINDRHVHPAEPTAVRLTLAGSF